MFYKSLKFLVPRFERSWSIIWMRREISKMEGKAEWGRTGKDKRWHLKVKRGKRHVQRTVVKYKSNRLTNRSKIKPVRRIEWKRTSTRINFNRAVKLFKCRRTWWLMGRQAKLFAYGSNCQIRTHAIKLGWPTKVRSI